LYVFDAPEVAGTFEERLKFLKLQSGKFPGFVKLVEFVECTGKEYMQKYFEQVILQVFTF
jgi:hypothetical protein